MAPTTTGWIYKPPPLTGPGEGRTPQPPPANPPAPGAGAPPAPRELAPPGAPRAADPPPRPGFTAPPPPSFASPGDAPGYAGPATGSSVSLRAPGIDPRMIAGGVAVVLVLILGFFLLRPKDSPAGGAVGTLDSLVGTCIRYSGDRAELDKAVVCTEPHDGVVVAFVTDQVSCPSEADGILATKADLAGTNGVLCIDETPATSS